jgi:hypothetical protein
LPNWVKDLIIDGGDPKHNRSRSEAAWKATLECVEHALDDTTIARIYFDPAHAIGEKAREVLSARQADRSHDEWQWKSIEP